MDYGETLQNSRRMSFFTFISENYEQSKFFLPKKKPLNDSPDKTEMEKLLALIIENDPYEINRIIKRRYLLE